MAERQLLPSCQHLAWSCLFIHIDNKELNTFMLQLQLNKTIKLMALSASLFLSCNWVQANEFYAHPNYFAFKQKAMSQYALLLQRASMLGCLLIGVSPSHQH